MSGIVLCCVCLACLVGEGIAQPSDELVLLERVLDFEEGVDATRLWERFYRSEFGVHSASDGRHAFFEVNQQLEDPGRTRFHFVLDDDGARRIQLRTSGQNIFDWIVIDDQWLVFGASSRWELQKKTAWSFHMDDSGLSFDRKRGDVERLGSIKLQPGQLLWKWLDSESPVCVWDSATRTLTATAEDGRRAIIRFRSPNDHQRFGSVLREICAMGTQGGHLSVRSIIVDSPSPLRVNIEDPHTLDERLAAIPARSVTVRNSFESVDSRRNVRKLEHEFCLKIRDAREIENTEFPTLVQQNVTMCLNFAALRIQSGEEIPNIDEFVEFLNRELQLMYLSVVEAVCDESESAIPVLDDTNLLSLGIERTIDGRPTGMLSNLMLRLLADDRLSVGGKIRLCMVLGEFGPIFRAVPGDPDIASCCEEGPFLEAILHARWGWPATPSQVAVCRERLEEEWPHPNQHEAAIDSLIRWGRLNDISDDTIANWFLSVVKSPEMYQHCAVKAMTRGESGRRFLLERLVQLQEFPEFRAEAARILSSRANASLRLKRFDFMTENECRTTLRVCSRYTDEAL